MVAHSRDRTAGPDNHRQTLTTEDVRLDSTILIIDKAQPRHLRRHDTVGISSRIAVPGWPTHLAITFDCLLQDSPLRSELIYFGALLSTQLAHTGVAAANTFLHCTGHPPAE